MNEANATEIYNGVSSLIVGKQNSFVPASLAEWLSLAILILMTVILVRKIFGADKKYHSKPMKYD